MTTVEMRINILMAGERYFHDRRHAETKLKIDMKEYSTSDIWVRGFGEVYSRVRSESNVDFSATPSKREQAKRPASLTQPQGWRGWRLRRDGEDAGGFCILWLQLYTTEAPCQTRAARMVVGVLRGRLGSLVPLIDRGKASDRAKRWQRGILTCSLTAARLSSKKEVSILFQ